MESKSLDLTQEIGNQLSFIDRCERTYDKDYKSFSPPQLLCLERLLTSYHNKLSDKVTPEFLKDNSTIQALWKNYDVRFGQVMTKVAAWIGLRQSEAIVDYGRIVESHIGSDTKSLEVISGDFSKGKFSEINLVELQNLKDRIQINFEQTVIDVGQYYSFFDEHPKNFARYTLLIDTLLKAIDDKMDKQILEDE